MTIEQLDALKAFALTVGSTYILPIIVGAIVLWIGMKVIRRVTKLTRNILTQGKFDITIAKFLSNLISFGLKALLIITVAGMVGVETTSFVAIIGAAGLAVGLALQGSLANFAGGMLILIFKPYQVGDRVEVDSQMGKVDEIDILLTTLITRDNKIVIVPNGEAANGTIINRSKKGPMRVEIPVGISYNADLKHAKEVLSEVLVQNKHILQTPLPDVVVTELADSSVNLSMRGFCTAENQPMVYSQVLEAAKIALDNAKIGIPYPHRVIHTA